MTANSHRAASADMVGVQAINSTTSPPSHDTWCCFVLKSDQSGPGQRRLRSRRRKKPDLPQDVLPGFYHVLYLHLSAATTSEEGEMQVCMLRNKNGATNGTDNPQRNYNNKTRATTPPRLAGGWNKLLWTPDGITLHGRPIVDGGSTLEDNVSQHNGLWVQVLVV